MTRQDKQAENLPRPKRRGGSPEREGDAPAVGMTNPADQGSWDLPPNPPNDFGLAAAAEAEPAAPATAAADAESPAGLTQPDPTGPPEPRAVGGNRSTTGPRRRQAASAEAESSPRRKKRGGSSSDGSQ